MRHAYAVFLLGLTIPTAEAHDFWLEPAEYETDDAGDLSVRFRIGHLDDQDDWYTAPDRIVAFRSLSGGVVTDHQASLLGRGPYTPATITLATPGTHVLTLEGHRAYSRLKSDKFNDYVVKEGILPILNHRVSNGLLKTDGTEVYARCAKTILTVAEPTQGDAVAATGMTLEITPTAHPSTIAAGERLRLKVTYRGEGLADATVHVTRLDTGAELDSLRTDEQGEIALTNLEGGHFMLHTAWAEPAEGLLEEATYATTFSSLTFKMNK